MKRVIFFIAFLAAISCASGGNDRDAAVDAVDGADPLPEGVDADAGDCPAGLYECGGECVDLMTDRSNCGACGRTCSAVQVCTDGECTLECPPDQTDCSGTCVDTQSDHDHCGSCGHACSSDEVCNEGICSSECGSGYTDCYGSCVDLQTSPFHCGFCGNACGPGEDCIGGTCQGGCGNGLCAGVDGENQCTCPADCGVCAGCCLYETCYPGGTTDACGSGGVACDVCSEGEICSGGACLCTATPCGSDCCLGGERCVDGTCCSEVWKTAIPSVYLGGAAIDADGTIYVSGQSSSRTSIYVAALDACGTVLSSTLYTPPGSTQARANRVALGTQVLTAGHVYTGTDTYAGSYCAFSRHPVTTVSCDTIDLTENNEEFWGIAASPGGFFWLSGYFDAPAANRPTLIKSTGPGSACGWDPLADTGGGEGRDIQLSGTDVYMTGGHLGEAFVARYAYGSCMTGSPCPHCDPDGLVKFMDNGASGSMGYDVAVSSSMAYVGGYKVLASSGAFAPMLAKVNLSTGALTASADEPDATPDLDLYTGVATDGTAVFAVGALGYLGLSNLGPSQGVLARFRTSDLYKDAAVTPPDVDVFSDVKSDGAGGIICVGASTTGGHVMRCTTDGTCAP